MAELGIGHLSSPTPNAGVAQLPQAPDAHVCVPQAPQFWVRVLMHWHPSLAVPLQLSSLPRLQVSVPAGPTEPAQVPHVLVVLSVEALHICDPALHGPLPSNPACAPQVRLEPVAHWQTVSTVLSGELSQSLSSGEVQSRALANTAPMHPPHVDPAQVWVPRLQIPTVAAGPHGCDIPSMQGQSLLGVPSHVASSPLTHESFAAGWMLQGPQ